MFLNNFIPFSSERVAAPDGPKKVLAVASGGGHWVQLLRMAAAFEGQNVVYATTMESYRWQAGDAPFYVVRDASRSNKLGLLRLAFQLLRVIWRERPDVVISTGAAPGYLALRLGKLFGASTVWVDSMANVERLSLSGERAGRHADLWLTQWPHLARTDGPCFEGAVI
jgi:UDP-N-acetylglucosamine:LPS N-acetylglucosamine transferase